MTDTMRDSEFLDFNTGIVKIDPMLLVRLSPPVSFEQKVRLFHCRVDVWTLGVAVEILKQIESSERTSIWSHAAYGLLAIGFSYFEMIGKTLNPKSSGKSGSGEDFNWGFVTCIRSLNLNQAATKIKKCLSSRNSAIESAMACIILLIQSESL